MQYKNYLEQNQTDQLFLTAEDDEHPKSIFFNLDTLKQNGTFNATCDYILKDWFHDYISFVPSGNIEGLPFLFELIELFIWRFTELTLLLNILAIVE